MKSCRFLLLLVSVLVADSAGAQMKKKFMGMGASYGFTNYLGDLDDNFTFRFIEYGVGLHVQRSLHDRFQLRATLFHDFGGMVVGWTRREGTAVVPPLLVQRVAAAVVGEVLVEIATASASGIVELAGPEPQDLVDMARRTNEVRGRQVRLVPTWSGLFGTSMAGDVLLPGERARLAPTTFDEWLAAGAAP